MARKANRKLIAEQGALEKQTLYRAGLYARLSSESRRKDSDSIENQLRLMKEYMNQQPDMILYQEYIDDGKTGTNFLRDGFEELMIAVRRREINCIIVKDLSRFARNHTEAGDYIEKIFPFLGIRFISVCDNYDSNNPNCSNEQLLLNLKNLLHEMYAKDISKKIYTSFQIKQKKGETIGGVPYGYVLMEGEKYLTIDDGAAEIVQMVYNMRLNGMSDYSIVKKLNELGILTPLQYSKKGHVKRFDGFEEDIMWSVRTIGRILCNETYTGNSISHKTSSRLFENVKKEYIDKEEWTRIEGAHTAIVTKDIFDKVQMIRGTKKNIYQRKCRKKAIWKEHENENIFKDIIFCGECKKSMYHLTSYRHRNKQRYQIAVFKCSSHYNTKSKCNAKMITEKELCQIIMKTINTQIKLYVHDTRNILLTMSSIFISKRQQLEKNYKDLEHKMLRLESEKLECYTGYASGEMNEKNYVLKKRDIDKSLCFFESAAEEVKLRLEQIYKSEKQQLKIIKEWLEYADYDKLTKEMIYAFIERIEIFPNKNVEVTLKYQDELQAVLSTYEEVLTWQA